MTAVIDGETLIVWTDHDARGEVFEATADDLRELVRCGEGALENELEDRESVVDLTAYFGSVLLDAELFELTPAGLDRDRRVLGSPVEARTPLRTAIAAVSLDLPVDFDEPHVEGS